MNRRPTFRLAVFAVLTLLANCTDPSGPSLVMTPRPADTATFNPTAPRPHLSMWLPTSPLGMLPPLTLTYPSVWVRGPRGQSLPNSLVEFVVISGGGSLGRRQVLSDDTGRAHVEWLLGPTVGRNVVRATSAITTAAVTTDTVIFEVEVVDVDSSRASGRFKLDSIDGIPLPMVMDVMGIEFELLSAAVEIRGSNFVFTWSQRVPGSATVSDLVRTGRVSESPPYLMFEPDGLHPLEYFKTSPALLLSDGRLRIGNHAEGWPLVGRYQDFKRAP